MPNLLSYTVKCRYDVLQYNMVLHTSLQEVRQNINERLNPQKTPHTSPGRTSYVLSFVNILEKIDRLITAPHYILREMVHVRKDWCKFII